MDQKISKYFCIFCKNCCNFNTIDEAYDHYKKHMKSVDYCIVCDNNIDIDMKFKKKCDEKHDRKEEKIKPEEECLIEMWIERFLSYQNELIDKCFRDLLMNSKIFRGCPVCESFIRLTNHNNIRYDTNQIRWSNSQSNANECRHASSHLRYYPFECLKCEKVGKYHKKCDFNEITRHIKDSHAMNLKDSNFISLVKSVKIRKLESFIDFGFKNKNETQCMTEESSVSATKPTKPIDMICKTEPEVKEPVSEPMPKRPRIETKPDVNHVVNNNNKDFIKTRSSLRVKESKNTTVCNVNNDIIVSIDKKTNNLNVIQKKIEISEQKLPKVEIKFMPNKKPNISLLNNTIIKPKTPQLISGDQIIIKMSNTESPKLEIRPAQKPVQPEFKTYSNNTYKGLFDEMKDPEMVMNITDNIELKNVDYFCVFCTEKLSNKEMAYKHYQMHVDYYPIICLTCKLPLTDTKSFFIHHREAHPEAVKGRFKKKEQSHIDKWISAFLYSQATIVKAFPPRDQCLVCARVFNREDIEANRPRRCTINRKIDHLQRHLCYLPYECLLCSKVSGQEFYVAYFESKAHSHIKQKHPDIDDNDSRWDIFQKTIFIPKLDEFIDNYLQQFGISMQCERRPVKKSNIRQFSSPIRFDLIAKQNNGLNMIELNNSTMDLNMNMIFSDTIDSAKVLDNFDNSINNKSNTDLMMIDSKNNTDIDSNEYNNNSNDSNIVVNVSPHSLFEGIEEIEGNTDEDLYFCIFCSADNLSKTEAYSHYGEHLDYFPVICRLCGSKFSNVDHLMTHHQSLHSSQPIVDYDISEDQILMKWVNEFIDFQYDYRKSAKKLMPCSCSYNCPVCVKLNPKQVNLSFKPCIEHNDVSFSVHIHQHLNYFPYECSICKRNGRSVRVPNLDAIAMNHVKEHKIENASMSQLCKNFPKTLVIPKLEKLIGDSVHKKRVSEKQNKSVINSVQESNHNSLLANNEFSTEEVLLTKSFHTKHIIIDGKRVINLTKKPINENSSNGNSFSGLNGGDGNGSIATNTNNVCCFHCRKSFPNRKSFKDHHNISHPGKAIVCSITGN